MLKHQMSGNRMISRSIRS